MSIRADKVVSKKTAHVKLETPNGADSDAANGAPIETDSLQRNLLRHI